jgi:hypothetical protein
MRRRQKTTPLELPDHVFATESFRPGAVAREISSGERRELTDPVVQQFPQLFRFRVPVAELVGGIDETREGVGSASDSVSHVASEPPVDPLEMARVVS